MVACPKCVVNNTLDSAFCKKCGAILPVNVIEEEQEKLKEIVSKGMESYQAGNLEEAMAIAEHSILSNPSYGEAYALKGLVHERRAEYAEALDAYETVVSLNPESTLDKIKLNQLRNAFAARQAGEPKIDRKSAAFVAVASMLAVLAVGAVSYGIIQSSRENKQAQISNVGKAPNNVAFQDQGNSPQMEVNTQPTTTGGNQPNPGNHDEVAALGGPDNNPTAKTGPSTSSNRNRFRGGGFTPEEGEGLTPYNPGGGQIGTGLPVNQAEGQTPRGPEPNDPKPKPNTPTQGGGSDEIKVVTNPKEPENTGVIDIQVSNKSGSNGTSRNDNHATSNGRTYQRQGQNYMRAGKTDQARDAYQKAIDAYQSDIESGKGDKEAAQAGINSCRQALKNLKS